MKDFLRKLVKSFFLMVSFAILLATVFIAAAILVLFLFEYGYVVLPPMMFVLIWWVFYLIISDSEG